MSRPAASLDITSDPPPAHGEIVAHIVEALRTRIARGELPPGERLVESELTESFSVSRGSVREALRLLAAEGLVLHAPNRGAEVRRLDEREKRELYQIVTELDVLGAGLAALCADPDRHAAFQATIALIYSDAPRSGPEFIGENEVFHRAVFVLADNEQLIALSRRLGAPLLLSISGAALTAKGVELSTREHRGIAGAIGQSDAERSRRLMRQHLERTSTLAIGKTG